MSFVIAVVVASVVAVIAAYRNSKPRHNRPWHTRNHE